MSLSVGKLLSVRYWLFWAGFLGSWLLFVDVVRAADDREAWLASEQRDHPLVGQLWSYAEQDFVDPANLLAGLELGSWLFIGEQHDHPDHQRLALYWLKALQKSDRLGWLALEMASRSQQPLLDRHLGAQAVAPEDLQWQDRGWPWTRYDDLVQAGLTGSAGVIAADLDREAQMQAYQEGAPRPAISDQQAKALDELIDQGHCGLLPEERLPSMRQVQLARDQAMAEALSQAVGHQGIHLLITGSVHSRQDLGVARWLPGEVKVTSVLLQAVDEERQEPQAYQPEGIDSLPAFDYIFFTPALPPVDYCEELRRSLEG
ncbi:Uncharacterized iron-regulated protein [Marinospirillum celere]|uniref:Uncharacterized iron-regulated protein n=1 Tax=Marinospirillum celere TaxID=1122252 RepID=A0A1I1IJ35_9GAMM|nr:ChaN family lipoprotein [Marinospirillum celere]SFC34208.1 Uncharacterized iron-regulated protein [Marinospirillum celere]